MRGKSISTSYNHLSRITKHSGRVARGQIIGYSGTTGPPHRLPPALRGLRQRDARRPDEGAAVVLMRRRGFDEQYAGLTPGLEPGVGQDVDTRRAGRRRDVIAVQFTPPKDVLPGELGTLIDERANVVDVTATIVDLAVRGYLRIEEIPKEGWLGKDDWRLVAVTPASSTPLVRYEQKLFDSIFEGRSDVLMSDLKQHFAADLVIVQSMLYDDVTERGWFRGNPATVRATWLGVAIAVIGAGAGLTVWLALSTKYALIPLGIVLGGLVLLAMVIPPALTGREVPQQLVNATGMAVRPGEAGC